jgi:hypothetical protein
MDTEEFPHHISLHVILPLQMFLLNVLDSVSLYFRQHELPCKDKPHVSFLAGWYTAFSK